MREVEHSKVEPKSNEFCVHTTPPMFRFHIAPFRNRFQIAPIRMTLSHNFDPILCERNGVLRHFSAVFNSLRTRVNGVSKTHYGHYKNNALKKTHY